jgi:4'-phosphopantetheinyl transferase
VPLRQVCDRCGGPHGRATLAIESVDAQLSISRTRRYGVLALGGVHQLGVDIEEIVGIDDTETLARTALAADELVTFAQIAVASRPRWITQAWTRKEALLKATGAGLNVDPRTFPVPLRLDSQFVDVADHWGPWTVRDLPAVPRHVGTVVAGQSITRVVSHRLPW